MGRLRRNKTVGLFPSNYVEVLENYERPGILSRPVSRAASPSKLGGDGDRGRKSRAASPSRPRGSSPSPSRRQRGISPQPPQHDFGMNAGGGGGGSSRSRTGRSPSPAPYQHGRISRNASPNPYQRGASPAPYQHGRTSRNASPNPYQRGASPAPYQHGRISRNASPNPYQRGASPAPSFGVSRVVSPAPSHYRAVSPAPSQRHDRPASPNSYMHRNHTPPPPAPPPHRVNPRAASPLPPLHDDRLTPAGSRAATPSGQTPSPLRNAMEDVMESLEHMTSYDDRPRTPQTPWSPDSFAELYNASPSARYVRPETSLGIAGRNEYEQEDDINGIPMYPEDCESPVMHNYAERMEDRLRRFQLSHHPTQRRASDDDFPGRVNDYTDRPRTCEPELRSRKSAHDLRAQAASASPTKMTRPRPLSRMGTMASNSTSNQSSTTASTTSTALTSASIMSGRSAGGFSATSAGSMERRRQKAMSMCENVSLRPQTLTKGKFGSIPGPSSAGYFGSVSSTGSGSGPKPPPSLRRGQTWGTSDSSSLGGGVLGGLTAPLKPKKSGFFKKILHSAKTSAASVRGLAESPSHMSSQFAPKVIPNGITAVGNGRSSMQVHGQDWVQVRRDVNRSNTLSRNERIERQEKQQMMDQPVLRPVDALDEDVDGDEAVNGGIVENPQDFDGANLTLVDKAARFIVSLPPFTTPESLATHLVCRPYRSDIQRLRAIFTWISEKIAWEHPSVQLDGEFGAAEVDSRRVLSQKRGSSEEIAVVVQGMCAAIGIPCDIVQGYLKVPGEAFDVESCPLPNHWWNAVAVDGEWRFMDCSLASPTHPRRLMYSSAPSNQAEFFYFLTKPSEFCWTHIPLSMEHQHMIPPLPMSILLALPCACPPFFKHGLQMINFDTSLTRMENLEVVQVEFSVPVDIECIAEVEANAYAVDPDGDVFETGEVIKKRALAQVMWENGVKTYRVKAVLPSDEGQGILKIYAGKRGLMVSLSIDPMETLNCQLTIE
jgi:hypothetical protein